MLCREVESAARSQSWPGHDGLQVNARDDARPQLLGVTIGPNESRGMRTAFNIESPGLVGRAGKLSHYLMTSRNL